jgi:hypothetical protein
MKKILTHFSMLTLALALLGIGSSQAQTTLNRGDISIVGWNSNTTIDEFTFVPWVNLTTGTVIKFTNNAFLSGASANLANNARVLQQIINWTATSNVPAGTTILVTGGAVPSTSLGSVAYNSQNQNGGFSLSTSGGRIFVYQGSDYAAAGVNPGTFLGNILFGLNYQGSGTSSSWLTSGTGNAVNTYLPSELGASSLYNIAFGSNANAGVYIGPRTGLGSFNNYRAAVLNQSNWSNVIGGSTVTLSTTSFSGYILPVTWSSFTARADQRNAVISWSTASEDQTRQFLVQHSTDGRSWETLSAVPAAGTSRQERKYTYTHLMPGAGAHLYRIGQEDLNGQISYTNVVTVDLKEHANSIKVLGNPVVNGTLNIELDRAVPVSIFTNDGACVYKAQQEAGRHQVDVSNWQNGLYILRSNEEEIRFSIAR